MPFVWNDLTGQRDMPWMGKGGRAHWYVIDRTKPWDVMDPRGPKKETHWGASGSSGESPWETGRRAIEYLARSGALKPWPVYPVAADSLVKGASTFPYRITIVAIEPTVAILRFDLSAAIPDPIPFSFGAYPPSQREQSELQGLLNTDTPNAVMFGTHIASGGSLLWFSPDAQVPPTPLELSGGSAEISAKGLRLRIEQRGAEIEVRRP
jgi:hypothetical protein